ncbi:Uncharacterised protein [Serratia proteamaculans]|uniref:hypothetical protein n=1 Tax=Serratia proteamaculans TaxID=28151 RepID=UPI002183101C|nr:hypothetical protein [Serratia proteamaculans]CAI2514802.1 Uncharacterised protein [Serratia proteamaculans]
MAVFICDKKTLMQMNALNHFQSGSNKSPELAGYDYLVKSNNGQIISNIQANTALDEIAFYTNFNPSTSGWDITCIEVKDTSGIITIY